MIEHHSAIVSHKHGTNQYSATSAEGLDAQLAGYVREEWGNEMGDKPLPEDLSDKELVDLYFGDHIHGETLDVNIVEHLEDTHLRDLLASLVSAAEGVVENWEGGDLAGAVNVLEAVTEDARKALAPAETPIGGACPSCGREDPEGGWYSPCPSDDCPSHDPANEQ